MDIETFEFNSSVIPYLFVLKTEFDIFNFYYKEDVDIISLFLNQIEWQTLKIHISSIDVFTHNINFDGFILIEYFLKKGIPYKWFLRDMNLYYIDFTYKGLDIRIRCSYKLLGSSVKNLGFLLGYPKSSFPYRFINKKTVFYIGVLPNFKFFENKKDYLEFYKKWGFLTDIRKVTIEYASRDVEIVYKSLDEIFKISYKYLFKNSFSFSSYSYKLFLKKYDKHEIAKIKIGAGERNYIENSYFGGRTEIFGNTKNGIIHRFDFPGMYGSCMLEKFPCGNPIFSEPKDFNDPGFYCATVLSNLKIPLLPIKSKNKKIIYPNGRFTTCLSRDEFILFLEKGGVVDKIHSALTFKSEDYVFKDFVEDFDKIKSIGGFHKLYGKQVINSLYGSFALRKDKIKYVMLYDNRELELLEQDSRLKSFIKFDKIIIAGLECEDSLNYRESRNLSYASFISSKARIKLNKNVYAVDDYYHKKYGDSYKLLYLETDSIDVALPEVCIDQTVMDVKWQKIYNGGVFLSPKFYFLKGDDRPRIKGVSNSKYTYEEICDSFYNNDESLIFKSQLQFSKKNFALSQNYIDKILKVSSYDKRIFTKDKLNTNSLEIWE